MSAANPEAISIALAARKFRLKSTTIPAIAIITEDMMYSLFTSIHVFAFTVSQLKLSIQKPRPRRLVQHLSHKALVGEEIASDELKERHAWYWRISRTSRVTKRKPMNNDEMQALAAKWDAGKTKTLGDLFHSEVVSLGLVTAYVNKFDELNEKLEDELARHENEA